MVKKASPVSVWVCLCVVVLLVAIGARVSSAAAVPTGIAATVSAPGSVTVGTSTCASVHLADGTGAPVQARFVALNVSVLAGTAPSGSTDADGNGSICYTTTAQRFASVTLTLVGTVVLADGTVVNSVTSNSVTQSWVSAPPPPPPGLPAPISDVAATVTQSSQSVYPGDAVTLTIVGGQAPSPFTIFAVTSGAPPSGLTLSSPTSNLDGSPPPGISGPPCRIDPNGSLACGLGTLPAGGEDSVHVTVTANAPGQYPLVLTVGGVLAGSGPQPVRDVTTMTFTLSVINPPSPTVTVGSGTKAATPSTTPTLLLAGTKSISILGESPTLHLTATVSKATILTLTLLDAKHKKLARWTKQAKPGKNLLALPLPLRARTAGRDTLRVATAGSGDPRALTVMLRR